MVKVIGSWINQNGYVMLRLSNHKCIALHKLIYQNLYGIKVPDDKSIDHLDYNINRNCASNLKMVDKKKNHRR